MAEGWILLYKKMISWEWYQDVNACKLFLHLLLKANYKQNTWQGEVIERGELITSREKLSAETGLTLQQTRTAEDKLKSTNDITIKSTNKNTRYFIVKYDEYQIDPSQITEEITNGSTDEQQTDNKRVNRRITTTNKDNKKKKEKEIKESKEASPDLFVETIEAAPKIVFEWFSAVQPVFEEFKIFRKNRKKPLSEFAEQLALRELEALRLKGHDPRAVIEQSIFRGWDGLFPIKEPDSGVQSKTGKRLSFQEQKDLQQQKWDEEARLMYEQNNSK